MCSLAPCAWSHGRRVEVAPVSFTWSRSPRNCWKSRPGMSLTWRGGSPSHSQRQASVLEVVDVKQTYCIDYLNIGWNVSFLKVFLETCLLVLDSGWGERPRGQVRQKDTAEGLCPRLAPLQRPNFGPLGPLGGRVPCVQSERTGVISS